MRYMQINVNGHPVACLQVDRGTTETSVKVDDLLRRHRKDRVRMIALDPPEERADGEQ